MSHLQQTPLVFCQCTSRHAQLPSSGIVSDISRLRACGGGIGTESGWAMLESACVIVRPLSSAPALLAVFVELAMSRTESLCLMRSRCSVFICANVRAYVCVCVSVYV